MPIPFLGWMMPWMLWLPVSGLATPLNLLSGYWQVVSDPRDREKTHECLN